ncbi:MAG TPA: hypothetical protein DDY13_07080 [Cytophagales bacterium]|jgi:opacity protein-like surface antigen|nr:hypothetical protein [Cytophagales bacterium]
MSKLLERYLNFGFLRGLCVALLLPAFSMAQFPEDEVLGEGKFVEGTLAFAAGFPVEEFAESIDNDFGIGLNFNVLYNPNRANDFFQFGIDFNYLHFEQGKVRIGDDRLKATNSAFLLHALGRLRVQTDKIVKPYADFFIGAKIMATRTKIDQDFFSTVLGAEEIILDNESRAAFSYGIGGGLTFDLRKVRLDIRISYLPGGKMEYIDPKSITDDGNGNFTFDYLELGSTAMILSQIGFGFEF